MSLVMKRPILAALVALNVALGLGLAAMWITPQGQLRNLQWVRPAAMFNETVVIDGVEQPRFRRLPAEEQKSA